MNALKPIRNQNLLRALFVAALSSITIFGSAQTFAAGPGLSGGNGGVVVNGRFYTLPEAGLKSVDATDPITAEMVKRTVDTVKTLMTLVAPLGRTNKPTEFVGKMFGSKREYVPVKVADPKLFLKIKSEYKPFVEKVGKGAFGLAAFTNGNTTYLLPEFFSADINTQARILIHEQIYALTWNHAIDQPGINLKDLLRFDIALLELMNLMPNGVCAAGYHTVRECGLGAWKMTYALHKLALPLFEVSREEAIAHALLFTVYSQIQYSSEIKLAVNRSLSEEDIGTIASLLGREVFELFSGAQLELFEKSGRTWVNRADEFISLEDNSVSVNGMGIEADVKSKQYSCIRDVTRMLCVR
jgi:hypothetical protein